MVYAHTVTRVTLSGTMFGGVEEWSTGFFLGQEGSDATVPTQAAADQIRDAWTTFFTAVNSYVSSAYRFTQVKMANIDATGHTVSDSVKYSYPAAAVLGNTGSNTHPPQCALVVTLLSDRPRGKASKGRMYLPGFAGPIMANGKADTPQVASIATNLKTFFDSFAADADVPDQLILAAKWSGPLGVIPAQNDYVETIRVGDVVDTQRRRRNGLAEVYTSRTLA
jgi:hypothetical protein